MKHTHPDFDNTYHHNPLAFQHLRENPEHQAELKGRSVPPNQAVQIHKQMHGKKVSG